MRQKRVPPIYLMEATGFAGVGGIVLAVAITASPCRLTLSEVSHSTECTPWMLGNQMQKRDAGQLPICLTWSRQLLLIQTLKVRFR